MKIKPLQNFYNQIGGRSLDSTRVYDCTAATNQPDWQEKGKVFVQFSPDSEESILLQAGEYFVMGEQNNYTRETAPASHTWMGPTGVLFCDVRHSSGTYYPHGTPLAVINALERARREGLRVRVFFGDSDTGLCWLEERDVCGKVGRSTGWKAKPLLIPNKNSHRGGAILIRNIVRLILGGQEVYRHPGYAVPDFEIMDGDGVEVFHGGELHARFPTETKAKRWIAFMRGERLGK